MLKSPNPSMTSQAWDSSADCRKKLQMKLVKQLKQLWTKWKLILMTWTVRACGFATRLVKSSKSSLDMIVPVPKKR